jgi:hypothetical protein
MAVVNTFVNATLAAGLDKTTNLIKSDGLVTVNSGAFEVAAADDDASVYIVFPIPSNAIPLPNGKVYHDSITGGTDYEFGLYERNDAGTFIVGTGDIDVFLGSTTMANTTTLDPFNLAMTVDNAGKAVWELLGLSADPQKQYFWGITANTVGTAAGTINVQAQYLSQG